MNIENNKKIVKDFYKVVFHMHNLNAVDRFMHDDYIQHNPDVAQGRIGFTEFHKEFFTAMPDHRATINMILAEGDLVFVYNTITGTHTGEGFLNYPPTGNKIKYDVVDMFRIRDGKLAEHWDVADTRALFSQVGAIKEVERWKIYEDTEFMGTFKVISDGMQILLDKEGLLERALKEVQTRSEN